MLARELELLRHSLSHDLRTPAMTILGFAELLTEQLPATAKNDSANQYLQHIRSSAQRQLTVIEKLLEYAQVSHQVMHLESIDMTALWQQQWQTFDNTQRQAVTLTVDALPTVQGDRTLLTTLVHALLDNALKFSRHTSSAHIHVRCETDQQRTWHVITDNGIGFHPDQAGRLFKPFQKLHANKQYAGSGMGLCLVARIVERHRGRIEATSKPNAGATFRFCLSP